MVTTGASAASLAGGRSEAAGLTSTKSVTRLRFMCAKRKGRTRMAAPSLRRRHGIHPGNPLQHGTNVCWKEADTIPENPWPA